MPGIPGDHELSKGPILQKIDEALNNEAEDFKKRSELLDALQDWNKYPSLPDLLVNLGVLAAGPDAQPLYDFWFGGTNQQAASPEAKRWWPEHQPIEPVIEGFCNKICFAIFIEAAKPNPLEVPLLLRIKLTIPITSPFILNIGPPEFP